MSEPLLPESRHRAVFDAADRFIQFALADQTYAIPIVHVIESGPLLPITQLPAVHSSIRGVINFRGDILPLLDLRAMLGSTSTGAHEKLLVVNSPASQGPCAFAVDQVLGLQSAPLPITTNLLDLDLLFQRLLTPEPALKGDSHVR